MIEHQTQPTRRSCGQTCVAMLIGVPAVEVLGAIQEGRGTTGKQLIAYLRQRGWTARGPVRGTPFSFPDQLAIARVIWHENRARTHWVVWDGARVYDPDQYGGAARTTPAAIVAANGRVMSYIPVDRPA